MALPESGDPGVARCRMKLLQKRRPAELPGQRVLTATGSDEEHAHGTRLDEAQAGSTPPEAGPGFVE
jgi:hypothetical protein